MVRHAWRPPRREEGWRQPIEVELEHLSNEERHLAAAGWMLSGQLEHASVAAFAGLTQHLIRLGAPSDLVQRSLESAMEEVRHAERCLGLASAYLGRPISVGAFEELDQASKPRGDAAAQLVRLALGSLRDGALGEGIAAHTASAALERVTDPALQATFAMIAEEESRHTTLAWDTLAWCVDVGGEPVLEALEAAIPTLLDHVPAAQPELVGFCPDRLAALGLLDQSRLGQIASDEVEKAQRRAAAMVLAGRRRLAA